MAIKASSAITLSSVVDVSATTRYYMLQSSTLVPPAKPTTNPPDSEWDDTEPNYTSGSTNTLYFTDLTEFSDGTWAYSSVSVSSAYEAAKEANNRANAAYQAVTTLDNSLTQQGVFNRLTNNGTAQGIYILEGQLYINATYMNTGELNAGAVHIVNLSANDITSGTIHSADYQTVVIDKIYPANNLYPGVAVYPNNGERVVSGFAIDFSTGQILGGFYSEQIQDLQSDVDAIESDISGLTTSVSGLQTNVSGLQTNVSGLQTNVSGLQTSVSGLQTTVSGLQSTISGIQSAVSGLQSAVTALQNALVYPKAASSGLQSFGAPMSMASLTNNEMSIDDNEQINDDISADGTEEEEDE